jgi:hypothetical protein
MPGWNTCRDTLVKLGEVASEFDAVHSIHRAVDVGSVDAGISANELRPRIVDVLDRALI